MELGYNGSKSYGNLLKVPSCQAVLIQIQKSIYNHFKTVIEFVVPLKCVQRDLRITVLKGLDIFDH